MGAPIGNKNASGRHKTYATTYKKTMKSKGRGRKITPSKKLMAKINPKKRYVWK